MHYPAGHETRLTQLQLDGMICPTSRLSVASCCCHCGKVSATESVVSTCVSMYGFTCEAILA